MGHWITAHLNFYFDHYGYWTILVGLLLENAGLPLPGETILVLATVEASTRHQLSVGWIVLVAVIAATMGDNLGYLIGRQGGRPLLERYRRVFHVKPEMLEEGERLMERHGAIAVFLARFVAALRVLSGPLAGILRMRWRRFFLFNALGAIAWVAAITSLAYLFGPPLLSMLQHASWILLVVLGGGVAAFWWWRRRRSGPSARLRKAA